MTPEVKIVDGVMYKQCSACNEFKHISKDYGFHPQGFMCTRSFCHECRKLRGRKYYADNKVKDNHRKRNWVLRNQYNLSREEYDEMAKNGCQSCGEKTSRLCVDHDHGTGKVRGILCTGCNTALGSLKDNEDLILKLASYIRERVLVSDHE
jgi:hypothetical protein